MNAVMADSTLSKLRRSLRLFDRIDGTALTSILVIILFSVFIFNGMLLSSHHSFTPDLPRVFHPVAMPAANREDALKVTITRDGQVYFGVNRVDPIALKEELQERLNSDVERKVYILADARVRWRTVKSVLQAVQDAGILRVAIMADQRRFH
jgi:biopolymer transport protein ExbD